MRDSLKDRKRALEEEFFAKYNAQLLADLKAKASRTAHREALAEVSGITDDNLLDRLIELDIESETLAALSLIPLVEIAWADGSLDPRERDAVLQAAASQGIEEGTPAHQLLDSWLERIPNRAILAAWKAYIGELIADMSQEERAKLRDELLQRARRIAKSAGGFLGFNKISDREESILYDLESVFE